MLSGFSSIYNYIKLVKQWLAIGTHGLLVLIPCVSYLKAPENMTVCFYYFEWYATEPQHA